MKIFAAISIIVILIASGCGDDKDARLQLNLINPSFSIDNIIVTAKDGGLTRVLDSDNFRVNGSGYKSDWINTRKSGKIDISFRIWDGISRSTDPDLEGSLELELKPDWYWSIDFVVAESNPALYCMGCSGSVGFELPSPLQSEQGDSLFLIWGGNSISNPVIY